MARSGLVRAAVVSWLCVSSLGWSQSPSPPTESARRVLVTRADIALAYQRFERAFLDHRPEGEELVAANLTFEAVTKSFFGMNLAAAISQLNDKAIELRQQRPASGEEQWLASLKVVLDPPIVVGPDSAELSLVPMYATNAKPPAEVQVKLRQGSREVKVVVPIQGNAVGRPAGQASLLPIGPRWEGTWKVSVALPAGLELETGRQLQGVERDLDAWREENGARLQKIAPRDPAMVAALATGRARNGLLKMKPGEALSTEFLADYNVLAPQVTSEVEQIEQGKDPYRHRRGDYWRVVVRGNTKVPMRVYVPEGLPLDRPVPLVLALHGAGGDENMFMDAYGEGALRREADRVGFIAVSPATFFFTARTDMLEPVLEDLSLTYPIDRGRVYVLGHSMGGGATSRLAAEQGSLLRAACCIAGFRGFPSQAKIPPTLVIAAENDAIIPAAGIEEAAKKGIADKLPITFELVPAYGHTLVVEAKLPEVIDWMWRQ